MALGDFGKIFADAYNQALSRREQRESQEKAQSHAARLQKISDANALSRLNVQIQAGIDLEAQRDKSEDEREGERQDFVIKREQIGEDAATKRHKEITNLQHLGQLAQNKLTSLQLTLSSGYTPEEMILDKNNILIGFAGNEGVEDGQGANAITPSQMTDYAQQEDTISSRPRIESQFTNIFQKNPMKAVPSQGISTQSGAGFSIEGGEYKQTGKARGAQVLDVLDAEFGGITKLKDILSQQKSIAKGRGLAPVEYQKYKDMIEFLSRKYLAGNDIQGNPIDGDIDYIEKKLQSYKGDISSKDYESARGKLTVTSDAINTMRELIGLTRISARRNKNEQTYAQPREQSQGQAQGNIK